MDLEVNEAQLFKNETMDAEERNERLSIIQKEISNVAKEFLLYLTNENQKVINKTFLLREVGKRINTSYEESKNKINNFRQHHISAYETSKMLNFSYYPTSPDNDRSIL